MSAQRPRPPLSAGQFLAVLVILGLLLLLCVFGLLLLAAGCVSLLRFIGEAL